MNYFGEMLRIFEHYMRKRSITMAHKKNRSENKEEYVDIDRIVASYRANGGLVHEYQKYKLWCLRKLLIQREPKRILELGSGSSTAVFADYIRAVEGRLLSVDENDGWANTTSQLIGLTQSEIPNMEIKAVARQHINDINPPEMRYDINIEEKFDFVFVDGPSFQINGKKHKECVNSNVFDLPEMPETIVVDIRKSTAFLIKQRYEEFYTSILSELFTGRPVGRDYNYFSIFIKR